MQEVKGLGASSGIAIGQTLKIKGIKLNNIEEQIENGDEELGKLQIALTKSKLALENLYAKTVSCVGKDEAEIFRAHIAMLEDDEFWGKVRAKIQNELKSAILAIDETADFFIDMFNQMDNEYIKERIEDIKEVKHIVSLALMNRENTSIELNEQRIIVASDLTAADTVRMDKSKVLGFVVENGGKTSHSAIIARSLGIPCVVGAANIMSSLNDNDTVILDGNKGLIIINPDEGILSKYEKQKSDLLKFKTELTLLKDKKSISRDGICFSIYGNIGDVAECDSVISEGGEGIGLFRTEFLFMGCRTMPTEEEQFAAYKKVAVKMAGKPVVIRTLDIGGDKDLPFLKMDQEHNPFLGVRAIRLCLRNPQMWRVQLTAILRASAYGNIKIMLPMISAIDELVEAKAIINDVKSELWGENISFDENMKIGMMIETPAAAILSDVFAQEADFFSIGTNDLVQYTMAADRANPNVANLYSNYNPAILRLIRTIIENAHKQGIKVGMCGEAAADLKLLPVFMGMGLDEFSVSPGSILELKYAMKQIESTKMHDTVNYIQSLSTSMLVEKYLS